MPVNIIRAGAGSRNKAPVSQSPELDLVRRVAVPPRGGLRASLAPYPDTGKVVVIDILL